MRRRGLAFGGAVTGGVLLFHTLLPLKPVPAAALVLAGTGAVLGNARAWAVIPAGLGLFRSSHSREKREERAFARALRTEGWVDVIGEYGRGRLVQVGERCVLVADTTRVLPPPGRSALVTLRLDAVRSRAERSSFRAEHWAASRGIDGRGRCVGAVRAVRDTRGLRGATRRVVHAVRERARRRLGTGRSPARDLVTALVIGDRTGVERSDLEAFRRAGLAHVLALSGMHVGVLALGVRAILRAARIPSPLVAAATVAFLTGFALMTGGSAPILRACGTGAAAIIAARCSRRLPAGHALAMVGGALLLARPAWLFDAGFRLSFLAAGTLALWARHARRPGRGFRGCLRGLADGLAMSACVTLATAPEIIASFGSVSLLSPVTNLLAAVPATLALGWGAMAALAPVPDGVAAPFGTAAAAAAHTLLAIAGLASRLPGGAVTLPTAGPGAVALVLATAALVATRRRPSLRQVARAAPLAVALGLPLSLPRERITVLDLGQGDAVLLEGGRGAVLVDTAGEPWDGREAPVVAALAARRARPLDALVLTHGHRDHTGGAETLLAARRFRALVTRPDPTDDVLVRLRSRAADAGVACRVPSGGALTLLGGRVRITDPWVGDAPVGTSENELSLATRWEVGGRAAWFLGDAGLAAEAALCSSARAGTGPARDILSADLLLAPHHGSRGSSGRTLLQAVQPRLVLVSCGQGNPYGHPHGDALERIRSCGAAVLRTDRDGTIAITASPRGFRIRWTRGFPGGAELLPPFPLSEAAQLP